MRALLFLAILVLVAPVAAAYPDPAKAPRYYDSDCFQPYDKRFVHDHVGLLADWGAQLEGAACEVYATTSAHVVIVTVEDTEGEGLENYALHLFEAWGIGDADREDGLLMLYVADYLQSGDAALRIEVGYGLEGVVSSPVTSDVWDLMIEARDNSLAAGDDERTAHAYAMAAGSVYLMETLVDGYTEAGFPAPTPHDESPPWWFWLIVAIIVIAILAALSNSSRGRRGWGYYPGSGAWTSRSSSIWVPSGGGGFGGGGSFGGGRSGGGGRGGRF